MSDVSYLENLSMPPGLLTQAKSHLARLARAEDALTLRLARERVEGFVEGIEVSRAFSSTTIEALYMAFENAITARELELEA